MIIMEVTIPIKSQPQQVPQQSKPKKRRKGKNEEVLTFKQLLDMAMKKYE